MNKDTSDQQRDVQLDVSASSAPGNAEVANCCQHSDLQHLDDSVRPLTWSGGWLAGNQLAVGQNQWDPIFGVGEPPILVHFSGDGDVHRGYGVLTHGQLAVVTF